MYLFYRWSQWEVAEGIKDICVEGFEPTKILDSMVPMDVENLKSTISENAVDPRGHFLREKVFIITFYYKPCIRSYIRLFHTFP